MHSQTNQGLLTIESACQPANAPAEAIRTFQGHAWTNAELWTDAKAVGRGIALTVRRPRKWPIHSGAGRFPVATRIDAVVAPPVALLGACDTQLMQTPETYSSLNVKTNNILASENKLTFCANCLATGELCQDEELRDYAKKKKSSLKAPK